MSADGPFLRAWEESAALLVADHAAGRSAVDEWLAANELNGEDFRATVWRLGEALRTNRELALLDEAVEVEAGSLGFALLVGYLAGRSRGVRGS